MFAFLELGALQKGKFLKKDCCKRFLFRSVLASAAQQSLEVRDIHKTDCFAAHLFRYSFVLRTFFI
jgi:hypothetical protein